MTIAITSEEVGGIIEVNANISLTPFIDVAVAIVEKHCTDGAFTTAELKRIALWLSAHFYAIRDPRRASERAAVVSKTIESKVDLGFDVTRYGQMAMRIDWSGALSALNEQAKKGGHITAGVTWLGTPVEEEEDDDE